MGSRAEREQLVIGGRDVVVTNPGKVLFPEAGYTKRDIVRYYLAVADGALRGAAGRPNVMVRYPDGIGGEFFYQKRAPRSRPPWIEVVALQFPSGRSAEEVVPRDAAALVWLANLGCIELHPHPVRADDLEHPDELRVDLDPVPGVEWPQVREVAGVVEATLADFGLPDEIPVPRAWTTCVPDSAARRASTMVRRPDSSSPGAKTSPSPMTPSASTPVRISCSVSMCTRWL